MLALKNIFWHKMQSNLLKNKQTKKKTQKTAETFHFTELEKYVAIQMELTEIVF